jgi:hypothetical protein
LGWTCSNCRYQWARRKWACCIREIKILGQWHWCLAKNVLASTQSSKILVCIEWWRSTCARVRIASTLTNRWNTCTYR